MGIDLMFSSLLMWTHNGFAKQVGNEHRVRMTLVVRDQANVNLESLAVANEAVNHIMGDAGIDVVWIDAGDLLNADLPPVSDSSPQNSVLIDGYFAVVVTPLAVKGSSTTEAGFAAVTTGRYRRAYVFYDRVKMFSNTIESIPNNKSVGIVLGHVIAHELGHLLTPGDAHRPVGIMRGEWDYRQWKMAAAGTLLFDAIQAKLMRDELLAAN
jgi:hypothetical protein